MSDGLYEKWVRALRNWAKDSTYDLSGLPPLSVDSFTPGTYQRLLRHLHEAMSHRMQEWSADLEKSLSTATGDYEIARELVRLRDPLARRVQLASHPALPAELSEALTKQAREDIEKLQAQLETNVMRASQGSVSSRARNERLLALVRQNKLTAVLDPNYKGASPSASSPDIPRVPSPIGYSSPVVRRKIHLERNFTDR
jgi:hypothetical protein